MKRDYPGIVHGSWGRLGRGKDYAEERARLVGEARQRRAAELACAPLWSRISIAWEIEREVRAKLRKKFPFGALYAARGRL